MNILALFLLPLLHYRRYSTYNFFYSQNHSQLGLERWTHVREEPSLSGCAVSISRNRTTGGRIVYDESDSDTVALLNVASSDCPKPSTTTRSRHLHAAMKSTVLDVVPGMKKALSIRRDPQKSSCIAENYPSSIAGHKSLDFQFGEAGHMKCPYCPKTFGFQSKLDRHVRAHTNERPFQCNYCPYRAKHRENLKTHCYIKHSDLGTSFNI
ncbi:Zinc finger C2H2-type [Trinorchestia longiramus]|nr:Zinc finger C2H2-type [Trinorchestia longiramus]